MLEKFEWKSVNKKNMPFTLHLIQAFLNTCTVNLCGEDKHVWITSTFSTELVHQACALTCKMGGALCGGGWTAFLLLQAKIDLVCYDEYLY